MKILVTLPNGYVKDTFFTEENIKLANSLGDVIWNRTEEQFTKEEMLNLCVDVDVIVTCWGSQRIDEDIVNCAKNLKILLHLAGTVTPFVSNALYEKDIKVISGNNFFAESVAEGTIAYILAALRDIPFFSSQLKNKGKWLGGSYNRGILDRTIGIVSFGAISEYLVDMLQVFRVNIKVYSRSISDETLLKYNMERASLEEIFSTCDVISVHTALNSHTEHMINGDLLSKINQDALLINTSRGAVVDEEALIQELETGRFKAVLDVYEVEPLPEGSKLRTLDNVILMPHMGGPTIDRRKYITKALLIEAYEFISKGIPMKDEVTAERAKNMSNS